MILANYFHKLHKINEATWFWFILALSLTQRIFKDVTLIIPFKKDYQRCFFKIDLLKREKQMDLVMRNDGLDKELYSFTSNISFPFDNLNLPHTASIYRVFSRRKEKKNIIILQISIAIFKTIFF